MSYHSIYNPPSALTLGAFPFCYAALDCAVLFSGEHNMSYSIYFETGVSRDGARYVARWDGEYCGHYQFGKAAQGAIRLEDKVEKAAMALDKVARPYFCDGRYGVWRAIESREKVAPEIESAFNTHHKAAMYLARYMGRT